MIYLLLSIIVVLIILGATGWIYCHRRSQRQVALLQTQHDAELQRFLRRLDHELKNPLTAIRFGLANLTLSATDPAVLQRHIQSIETQTLRMGELLTNLRKLAELTQVVIEYAPVNVQALLEEAITLTQEQADYTIDRQVELDCSASQDAYGDKYLLLLAVYNVLDNALKFTDDREHIRVQAYDATGQIVIQVIDQGPGIPEQDIEHVWEELYRVQTMGQVPGSGIGLALVKAIVEKHSGYVTLESEANVGTTVSLILPTVPHKSKVV